MGNGNIFPTSKARLFAVTFSADSVEVFGVNFVVKQSAAFSSIFFSFPARFLLRMFFQKSILSLGCEFELKIFSREDDMNM